MARRLWLPPVPREHGAKTLLVVGLLTPLSVYLGTELALTPIQGRAYLLFAGIATGALFYREAVRQYLLARPEETRWDRRLPVIEGAVLLTLVASLVGVENPWWGLLVLVIPGVAIEAFLSLERDPTALAKAAVGVLMLGLIVPVGMVLVGFTDPMAITVVFGLFLGYHFFAVLRVGSVVGGLGTRGEMVLLVPIVMVVLTVVGYEMTILGVGAPIVFVLSGWYSALLTWVDTGPSLKRLGQTEAMLSLIFVLSGPFLLP